MNQRMRILGLCLALVAGVALLQAGCKPPTRKAGQARKGAKAHDHSGWWCDEHGVPEEECSLCSDTVAKECKAKGDWCTEHDRAKSHCFKCDPKLKEKFAARYREKYGKEPPPTEDDEPKDPKK